MAGNESRPERWQIAFHNVQVSATNSASYYAQQDMADFQLRTWNILNMKIWYDSCRSGTSRSCTTTKDGRFHFLILAYFLNEH